MRYVLKRNGSLEKWINIYILYIDACYQIAKPFTIHDDIFLLFFRSFNHSVLHFGTSVPCTVCSVQIQSIFSSFDHRFGLVWFSLIHPSIPSPVTIKHKLICLYAVEFCSPIRFPHDMNKIVLANIISDARRPIHCTLYTLYHQMIQNITWMVRTCVS